MGQTPGQKLEWELKSRNIGPVDFAKKVRRSYQTVYNWTQDNGFKEEQRKLAAAGLGEPPDFFDYPDIAAERENFRRSVLKRFSEEPLGKSLSPEEWRSLNALRWPVGREPSVADLRGWTRIIRGQLSLSEFEGSIDAMRESAANPMTNPDGDGDHPKKPRKKGGPTKTHKRPRK